MRSLFLYNILILLLISYADLFGIGANPNPIKFKQSNGAFITVKQHGDEYFHWITTVDGYRIVRNHEGIFEYAALLKSGEIVPSGIKVSDINKRNAAEKTFLNDMIKNIGVSKGLIDRRHSQSYSTYGLKSVAVVDESTFPKSGTHKLLVILANFNDTDTTFSRNQFNNLMNQPGYNGKGSFKDFYIENSNGTLIINSDVTTWVTLPNNHQYYGYDNRIGEFARDAVAAANAAGVDFSQYDNDGDGVVDGISIIHQGRGEEGSSESSDIWSMSITLSSFYNVNYDGVKIDHCTIQPEKYGNSDYITTIGVLCHEFGHNLGAPDYYDIDDDINGFYDGTGMWDLMAVGAYNSSGSLPAHNNPLTKWQFGWINVETLSEPQNVTVTPVISAQQAYKINTTTNKEFFLLENRQLTGFDAGLPGSGLLIYHVDSNYIASHYNTNDINNDEHQGLYPVAAGGEINIASCPFPGTSDKNDFTDDTDPNALSWIGNPTDKSVTGITVDGSNIVFDFMAIQNGSPLSLTAKTIDYQSIQLSWKRSDQGFPVLLAYSENNIFGDPLDGNIYNSGDDILGGGHVLYYGNDIDTFFHAGLSELKTYHYRLWSNNGTSYTVPLKTATMTMAGPVTAYPWNDDFEEGMVRWRQEYINGYYDWELAGGGHYNYPAAAYSGVQNLLFFTGEYDQITDLISPVFIAGETQKFRLEFYHAQTSWLGDQDSLEVLYRNEGDITWNVLKLYPNDVPGWMERNIDFIPGGNFELAFRGYGNYGYGIAVDKVSVYPYDVNSPVNNSTNFTVTNETQTSLTVSWTPGDGDRYLLVGRRGGPVRGLPDDGIVYNANKVFGSGEQLETGDYILSADTAKEVTITGVQSSSTFYFSVFDYDSATHYYQTDALLGTGTTLYGKDTIAFNVLNESGEPVGEANVTIGEVTGITDVSGVVDLEIDVSDTYVSYKISKNTYNDSWGKFIPSETSNIDVTMREFRQIGSVIDSLSVNYRDVFISWNPVINENFSNYEPFALSIPNWIFKDLDGGQTYGFENISFPNEFYTGSFIVMNPYVSGGMDIPAEPFVGEQFLGCVASTVIPNNDWIISPEISIQQDTWLSFMAKSYSSGFTEKIRVLVSESGMSEVDSFKMISQDTLLIPNDWTNYVFDLSTHKGKSVRFAINCVSEDAYMLMLDQIIITNSNPVMSPTVFKSPVVKNNIPGKEILKTSDQHSPSLKSVLQTEDNVSYKIYRNGQLVTELKGLTNTEFSESGVVCGNHEYEVRVNYKSPEIEISSLPVNVSTCNSVDVIVSDVDGILADAAVIFNGETLFTDESGNVHYDNIANGDGYTLSITKTGYMENHQDVSIAKDTIISVVMEKSSQVEELDTEEPVVIPNPTSGPVKILLPPSGYGCNYTVFNVAGNAIQHGKSDINEIVLDLTGYPGGIYFIRLNINNKIITLKVQKR